MLFPEVPIPKGCPLVHPMVKDPVGWAGLSKNDIEQQVKRMARDGTPYYTQRKANRRHGHFALKVEGNDVVWIGLADPPRRPRTTK